MDSDLDELLKSPEPNPVYPPGTCQYCGESEGVQLEDSRTAYDTTPFNRFDRILKLDEPDPNAPIELCRDCAEEHHSYWDEMWAEVNRDRL